MLIFILFFFDARSFFRLFLVVVCFLFYICDVPLRPWARVLRGLFRAAQDMLDRVHEFAWMNDAHLDDQHRSHNCCNLGNKKIKIKSTIKT